MPWDWQPVLQKVSLELGMDFFSTPFDPTSVDFLESLNVPVHKVASFELVDLPLLRKIAATGKPIIMSTGMATVEEISEALETLMAAKSGPIALLKCTSAYPALASDMDLRTIPDMATRFGVPVGLSDHTMGHIVPVTAVTLGACIVEKHFILSRSIPGPDAAFSMEPLEFRNMVEAIRTAEQALGSVNYEVSDKELKSRMFRRSLFVTADVKRDEEFTTENVRSIRPAHGLHPRHLEEVLGARATRDIEAGTPLELGLVQKRRL
jgi:N-acetylneuraminate synthase